MQIAFAKALMNLFCTGVVFTACINNYKVHTFKPRRRKELPIFCTLITFILLTKYLFRDKYESASYYKTQLVTYRWKRQFLYFKIIGVGMFYTFSCEVYSTWGFHRSFFSLWDHAMKTPPVRKVSISLTTLSALIWSSGVIK